MVASAFNKTGGGAGVVCLVSATVAGSVDSFSSSNGSVRTEATAGTGAAGETEDGGLAEGAGSLETLVMCSS